MVRIPPWGKREIERAFGAAVLWMGHVYGPCACTHGGCCATQSVGGVVPTSSSSHNLAVRGEHQENGACTCAMHAKRSQTRFTIMQWHAMTMFVRTFSVGRYSD